MSEPVLQVEHFRKSFNPGLLKKQIQAATDISFTVEAGEVFGFLGPNGAGKTTTIKAMLGLIRPTSGHISILGEAPGSYGWRSQVGYMPEHPNFYDFLTGRETVAWFGRLSGLPPEAVLSQTDALLEKVGLGHAKDRRLRTYSKGMLQRVGLAQAMLGPPRLLILDEPMGGLDPIGRREVRELILSLRDEGITVVYSTHILPDVEMTCDRVVIVESGRTRYIGPVAGALGATQNQVRIEVSGLSTEAIAAISPDLNPKLDGDRLSLVASSDEEARRLLETLIASGATLQRFEPQQESLESIFMRSLSATKEN